MAQALEALIQAEGPETIAAFFRPSRSWAPAADPAAGGYFDAVQEVLRRHNILFVPTR